MQNVESPVSEEELKMIRMLAPRKHIATHTANYAKLYKTLEKSESEDQFMNILATLNAVHNGSAVLTIDRVTEDFVIEKVEHS